MKKKESRKKMICITGYPGSGKSVFATIGEEYNLKIYTMGDVVRREAINRYGMINKETLGKVAEELRNELGDDAVAILLSKQIKDEKDSIVVIDGIRSLREIEILSEIGKIILIAIIAKKTTRFLRLVHRRREDDMMSYKDFIEREIRERRFGLDKVIENADIYIFNENIDLEDFKNKGRKLFKKILVELNEEKEVQRNNKTES